MWNNHKIIFGTHTLTSAHISSALKAGYRVLDTATGYKNATEINKAIHETGIHPVILTKYNPSDFKKDFREVVLQHHEELGREPDIVLLHSPLSDYKSNVNAFKLLKEVYPGKLVGVANFREIERLQYMIEQDCEIDIISLEFSPFYQPTKLMAFCEDNDIIITGYRPTYKGEIFKSEELKSMALDYSTDVANLVLKWASLKGVIPIVSSKNEDNMKNNLGYVDVVLSDSHILDHLNTNKSTCMFKYCNHNE
jgi:diketogulonate reductase-like aldo/keto reductase